MTVAIPETKGPGATGSWTECTNAPVPFLGTAPFSLLRRLASSASPRPIPFCSQTKPKEIGMARKAAQRKEVAEAESYEEQRRRQVEANKRKLEELQLHHLSAAVREAATAAVKPSPVGPNCLADGAVVSCVDLSILCFFSGFTLPQSAFLLQAKKRKARVLRDATAEPLRRSGRVANLPDKPKYREVGVQESYARPKISSFFFPSLCEEITVVGTNWF